MLTTAIEEKCIATDSAWKVFVLFLRLGFTSFGGPVAHLAYFREEFVTRRNWLSERSYVDIVALCQFLPGPASSQVGIALGMTRSGFAGAVAAWAGFTLPSALMLVLFAMSLNIWAATIPSGALHGLKVVAVAVVAQAVWGMARSLGTDAARVTIGALSACVVLLLPSTLGQLGVLVVSAMVGTILFKQDQQPTHEPMPIAISRRAGAALLGIFFALLAGLPLLLRFWPNQWLALMNAFFRAGSLVFGGGHVMLPLLQAAVVPTQWVSSQTFLAGYGMTQAVPGPLTTFAAFLGASMNQPPSGWLGALICLVSIFTPSFLLIFGALPFWEQLRRSARTQAALAGVNASVVGLLLAALYTPVWTSAVLKPIDFGMVVLALVALMSWKLSPWLVVLSCGAIGWALASLF